MWESSKATGRMLSISNTYSASFHSLPGSQADGMAHLREISTQLTQTIGCLYLFFCFCTVIFLTWNYSLELTNLGLLTISHFWWFTSICFCLTRLKAPKRRDRAQGVQSLCALKMPSTVLLGGSGLGEERGGPIQRRQHLTSSTIIF